MKILSIDTSCDETSAAVTEGLTVVSNTIWSQASAHAKFGGVMPSLAQRMHEERIDFVVKKALAKSKQRIEDMDAIAVTIGPGLSIALGVGVKKAKELAIKFNKKLITINHLEGHLVSPLALQPKNKGVEKEIQIKFPAIGLIISGGNTVLVKINKIGSYDILASTTDDALGEALDKAARMLGFGYPGGAILEKFARGGKGNIYKLPIPIIGHEEKRIFTYSGIKTAMMRLIEKEKPLNKNKVVNLAASFQDAAFHHLTRVIEYCIKNLDCKVSDFLVGGGVAANVEVRKRLRQLSKNYGIKAHFPISKKLYGDNAAMIGLAAHYKYINGGFTNPLKVDRNPNLELTSPH